MVIKPLILALQLLTRIPIPIEIEATEQEIGKSILFYPFVGLIIGSILYFAALLLPAELLLMNAAIVTALWIALTGALHIDGLADSADAWVGGMGDASRTLEIMKDPTCGPMGVTTIVVTLLLKFAAIFTLLESGYLIPLLLIPMLGRAQVLLLFLTTPYVRPGGMGSVLATHLPKVLMWIALPVAAAIWIFMIETLGAMVIVVLLLMFWLYRQALMKRIGGTTGDTAGALIELSELVLLVGIVI